MNRAQYLIYVVCGLAVFANPCGKLEAAEKKAPEVRVEQEAVTKLSPILIYDEHNRLEITIEEAGKYHGDICICFTIAFRATRLAISRLWRGEIPRRGDFKIVSALPTPGSRDAFEFITRVVTREKGEDFKFKMPEGADIRTMSKDNFTFTFIRKSSNEQINIRVKETVFPEGYFELRNKVIGNVPRPPTSHEERIFKQAKQKLTDSLLYFLPENKIFDFEIVSPD